MASPFRHRTLTASPLLPLVPSNETPYERSVSMLAEYEADRHHLLAMIEAAQRAGRSEREVVAIVDRYFGDGATSRLEIESDRGFARRLLARASARRAG
jgi:hypothetical protein